ncbi:hypothetical protein GTP91_23700 [Rugamonas sp. FT82W]|uniref:Insecticide toxin TcdB middle/N-terminal domain-containing protein n=1 Tax=Duganella vulcania TaxID=2692166 RepID=A0A845G796_9BURK|nr:FG-GAP-like repeat-containing protein [Duganella vulcania]MYM90164.1 hypothetical protein [Duganella vulcania]
MLLLNSRFLTVAFLVATTKVAMAQQLVTPSKFSVSPGGSAQFVVPIKVPAGVAGMQPDLALVYDSKDRRKSWLGVGWSMSGLSSITRCPKTMAQDAIFDRVTISDRDSYCLDGERLIAINGIYGQDGTEYRTERDTFARIVSHGALTTSSSWFSVQTKSGRTMEYGSTYDAHLFSPTNGRIKGWAVNKIKDQAGNYMNIAYEYNSYSSSHDNGIFRPLRIDYSANASAGTTTSNSVIFAITDPMGLHLQFEAGFPIAGRANQILGTIYTYVGVQPGTSNGAQFGSYKINYDSGTQGGMIFQLTSIQECNFSVSSTCLPAINFSWEDRTFQAFQFWTSSSAFPGANNDYQSYFVDLNGDGKKAWLQISQASDDAWIGKANLDASMTIGSWSKVSQSIGALSSYAHYFADVNGDGKADWIRISRTTNEAWIALGTGDGNFDFWTKHTTAIGSEANYGHYFADIDGDGRADLIQISRTTDNAQFGMAVGDGGFNYWSKTFAGNYGLTNWDSNFVDIDGDGKADWVVAHRNSSDNIVVRLSLGDGTFSSLLDPNLSGWSFEGNVGTDITIVPGSRHYFADVNGDGLMDWIVVPPTEVGGAVWLALSKGNGGFTKFVAVNSSRGNDQFPDVNGDGRADWVTNDSTSIYIRTATGDIDNPPLSGGSVSIPVPATGAFSNGRQYFFADLNGDGRDDLIAVDTTLKKAWIAKSTGQTDTKITSFFNTPDATTSIVYKRLSDASVYTPDTDAQYPLRDSVFPLLVKKVVPEVVASVAMPNGIGGTVTTNYTYGGQKTDLSRRQVLGFRWMQSVQVETGVATRTDYRLDWPYTGMVNMIKKTITGGGSNGMLSQISYLYGCNDFVSQGGCVVGIGKRYFPFVSQVNMSSWDLNGVALPSAVTNSQFDAWGNATQIISTSSDGFSKTTTNSFNNDASTWHIGQLVRQVVTNTSP